jgi:hypothetical protein
MTAQMSAAATADILITGSLLYYLKKSKVAGTRKLRYPLLVRFRERLN